MTIKVKKGKRSFPVVPSYISDLTGFIINNISENSLIHEFCYVIDQKSTKKEFEEHNNNFLPETELERELMELLDELYRKADKGRGVDNERGDLLEYLVYEMSLDGKYTRHRKWFHAVLDIVDSNSRVLFSMYPCNIDFFFEKESQDNRAAIDCKIKIFKDKRQLQIFNDLAKGVEKYGISCLVGVVHLVREEAWIDKYKTWYQKIEFIGPDALQDRLT